MKGLNVLLPDWVARKHEAEEVVRILDNPTPEPKPQISKKEKAQKKLEKNFVFGVKMPNGMRVKGNMSPTIKSRRRKVGA